MSGHSRWAQIKHKKAGTDAKRGALFSKLSRLISAAAREGGPNPETNFRLRQAVDQARSEGLPKDNIERTIARAAGGGGGISLQQVEYEAYGPGGSAFLISGLTDNANRTTSEIKHILDDYGGRLAEAGSVSWMFDRRVIFELEVPPEKSDEAELAIIDAGAEDTVVGEGGMMRAVVPPEKSESFRKSVLTLGMNVAGSVFAAIPKTALVLDESGKSQANKLVDALENHADVNEIWTNYQ